MAIVRKLRKCLFGVHQWKTGTYLSLAGFAAGRWERGAELYRLSNCIYNRSEADVAQLVEQSIRNRQVIGSSPIVGSRF